MIDLQTILYETYFLPYLGPWLHVHENYVYTANTSAYSILAFKTSPFPAFQTKTTITRF